MGINVTTSKQQITASVADDKIVANVTGGFGATGPSGVINVTAPITNAGTTTAANVGLSVGTGLSVSGGSLVVTPGTYATLVNGTVPAEQLPSYVDDVLEYANLASFPVTGESGKIYVALNSGKCYRWSGSAYFEISTQPGDTDAVPEGSTNLYFTNARARNAFGSGTTGQVLTWSGGQWTAAAPAVSSVAGKTGTVTLAKDDVGLGNVDNTSDANKPISTAVQTALDGKQAAGSYAAASHTHTLSAITDAGTAASKNAPATGNASSTQVVLGSDTRLTDSRSPTAHTHGFITDEGGLSQVISGSIYTSPVVSADNANGKIGIGQWGTTVGTFCQGNDSRLSDARTPTAHKSTHATGGSDALTASDIGAAAASHTHGGGDITFTFGAGSYTAADNGPIAEFLWSIGDGDSGGAAVFLEPYLGNTYAAISHAHSAADVTSGTFDVARLPVGTGSTQVAAGDHTHSQLHDRSHAMTSTSDHTAGNWKVFHSNGSGQLVELAVGAANTVLTSNGASSAPTFSALPAGGTKTIIRFTPGDNNPPAAAYATLDTRNSVLVLEFDAATDESAVFTGYIPEGATLTNGLKVRLSWMADTATSGNVRWGVQFEADGTDLDSDSFDTATLATSAANGTSGIETLVEITATSIDSLVAGDRFRLKVYRDADDATNDTMTGDAQLVAVEVQAA